VDQRDRRTAVRQKYRTQAEAVDAARLEAAERHLEHHIHDEHGLRARKDSYG